MSKKKEDSQLQPEDMPQIPQAPQGFSPAPLDARTPGAAEVTPPPPAEQPAEFAAPEPAESTPPPAPPSVPAGPTQVPSYLRDIPSDISDWN